MTSKIPYLRYYPEISNFASDFLKNYNPENIFPLPIEEIVELKLKIKILPIPELKNIFNIEGFISSDAKTITVDQSLYENLRAANRYRLTLAHEIGHMQIHEELLSEFDFDETNEFLQFRSSFTLKEISYYEFQAYAFAGLILVPQSMLIKDLIDNLPRLAEEEPSLRKIYVGNILSKIYSISAAAVHARINCEKKYNKYLKKSLGHKLFKILEEMC